MSLNQQDDISSSSGEEEDTINVSNGRNKQQRCSATPSTSVRRKRGRKGPNDAIVDAILEIANASRMRATAMTTKADDRFSITNCINVLDMTQGVDQRVYYAALDLFENPNARETFISLKGDRRLTWLQGKCNALSGSTQ
ncbi:hypothetical protein GIB67_026199 [Kingdonia uniflora]|uniref:Uncharacterized protein n=1 Tax=Kingdonia uniflora TaxID=39325 RepID=A0A7J7L9N9_9MAGN|nr:hypothetical protein GIB67_026199 [Kingdonia uniflora]